MGAKKEEGKMPKTISISKNDIKEISDAVRNSEKSTAEQMLDSVFEAAAAPFKVALDAIPGKKDDDKIQIKLRD